MLRGLATPLRILMLLVIFITGSAGHHVAMAASPAHDHHAVSVEPSATADHHSHHNECANGVCNAAAEESCCLMGQCMLALAMPMNIEWHAAPASVRRSNPCMSLVPVAAKLPFRPPQA